MRAAVESKSESQQITSKVLLVSGSSACKLAFVEAIRGGDKTSQAGFKVIDISFSHVKKSASTTDATVDLCFWDTIQSKKFNLFAYNYHDCADEILVLVDPYEPSRVTQTLQQAEKLALTSGGVTLNVVMFNYLADHKPAFRLNDIDELANTTTAVNTFLQNWVDRVATKHAASASDDEEFDLSAALAAS